MKKLYEEISKSIKKYKLDVLKDVIIFIIITLAIHYSYRFWANKIHYWPVSVQMNLAHDKAAGIVYDQSVWIIRNILSIPVSLEENRLIRFENNGFIAIDLGCSGLKPILQFLLLMLIFPGPWKHKAWFLPLGVLIVHATNLFRICGLAVITVTIPEYWDFSHDYLFRPFFYVVIFLLWVWWVEKFRVKGIERRA
jgi:exosortase/archaeosortase family protein